MMQDKLKWSRLRVMLISVGSAALLSCGGDSTDDPFENIATQAPQKTYNLVWNDEFGGSDLNAANWAHETGAGGWGNNELQFYQADNTTVANGMLTITAREESSGSPAVYTSSRISSEGLRFFEFGKVEVRARLPGGKGIWPAIWMMGENLDVWPQRGEIDIMEMKGSENDTVYGTIHWDGSDDDSGMRVYSGGSKTLDSGNFSDQFHVFSIEWDDEQIRWYVDGKVYHGEDITDARKAELRDEFFLLINVAVGGDYDGDPDGTTSFPQSMMIDYVRVYEEVSP